MTNFDIDEKFMALAINLSKKNQGITAQNPSVGCVIVQNGAIIATGVTARGGRPHAEQIALENAKKAGKSVKGATLYVSLEPCCHYGETGPCVDLVIESQIGRVVIGVIDLNDKVDGKGIDRLHEAGLDVKIGVLEDEAKEINRGFFAVHNTGLPFVTVKLGVSADFKIADRNYYENLQKMMGQEASGVPYSFPQWITNEKSRKYAHYLRAKNDAILVGSNTARMDDPMLDCRLEGLEDQSPIRVIVSASLDIDLGLKVVRTAGEIATYVATKKSNKDHENVLKLAGLGVKILFCEEDLGSDGQNRIDLVDLLENLADLGVNNLLVEGGSDIVGQFLKKKLINRLILMKSDKIIGEKGVDAIKNVDFEEILGGKVGRENLKKNKDFYLKMDDSQTRKFGDDEMVVFNSFE